MTQCSDFKISDKKWDKKGVKSLFYTIFNSYLFVYVVEFQIKSGYRKDTSSQFQPF